MPLHFHNKSITLASKVERQTDVLINVIPPDRHMLWKEQRQSIIQLPSINAQCLKRTLFKQSTMNGSFLQLYSKFNVDPLFINSKHQPNCTNKMLTAIANK